MQIFGYIENTRSTPSKIVNEWGIPAQNENLARRQARINARIKHGEKAEVLSVEEDGEGRLPGQRIYLIETEVPR
jgi:hypothetical protein